MIANCDMRRREVFILIDFSLWADYPIYPKLDPQSLHDVIVLVIARCKRSLKDSGTLSPLDHFTSILMIGSDVLGKTGYRHLELPVDIVIPTCKPVEFDKLISGIIPTHLHTLVAVASDRSHPSESSTYLMLKSRPNFLGIHTLKYSKPMIPSQYIPGQGTIHYADGHDLLNIWKGKPVQDPPADDWSEWRRLL